MQKESRRTPAGLLLVAVAIASGCARTGPPADQGSVAAGGASNAAARPFVRPRSSVAPYQPFAVLRGDGSSGTGHPLLVDAIQQAGKGDVIEIRAERVVVPRLAIEGRDLVLWAGAGVAPVLTADPTALVAAAPQGGRGGPAPALDVELIEMKGGSLTLAGLGFSIDLERAGNVRRFSFWKLDDVRLRMLHCTVDATISEDAMDRCAFVSWQQSGATASASPAPAQTKTKQKQKGAPQGKASAESEPAPLPPIQCAVDRCVFRGPGAGLAFQPHTATLAVARSLFAGVAQPLAVRSLVSAQRAVVQLTQNTFVSAVDQGLLHIEARRNAQGRPEFDARYNVFVRKWYQEISDPLIEVAMYTPDAQIAGQSFAWQGTENAFVGEDTYVRAGPTEWLYDSKEAWQAANPGSEGDFYDDAPPFVRKPPRRTIGAPAADFQLLPVGRFARGATDGTPLGAPVTQIGTGPPFDQAWRDGNPLDAIAAGVPP